jgi:hypothetical protein
MIGVYALVEYEIEAYLKKAAHYDLMAQYYKYLNPELHIKYYKKHLKYLKTVIDISEKTPLPNPFIHTRFLNLVNKAVDIRLNDTVYLKEIPTEGLSEYFILPTNVYQLEISPSASSEDRPIMSRSLDISGENFSTYMITNDAIHHFPSEQFLPENEVKLRVIHLSKNTNNLDVRVKGGDCVFGDVSFGSATPYLGLSPISVDLELTISKTKHVLLPIPKIGLQANTIYSLLILNDQTEQTGLKTLLIKD